MIIRCAVWAIFSVIVLSFYQVALSQNLVNHPNKWYPNVQFVVNQEIFEKLGDQENQAIRVSSGAVQVWCVDTKWFDQSDQFIYKRDSHFYGDGGGSNSEAKTYVGFSDPVNRTIAFTKLKYDNVTRYSDLTVKTLVDWQFSGVFSPQAALKKEVFAVVKTNFTVKRNDIMPLFWHTVMHQANSTGKLSFVIPDVKKASSQTGDGFVIDVNWNNAAQSIFDEHIHGLEFGTTQLANSTYAYMKYVALQEETNALCQNGSLFVFSEPGSSQDLENISVVIDQDVAHQSGLDTKLIITD